jgi:exodeoxyribonuclease VII small subunit
VARPSQPSIKADQPADAVPVDFERSLAELETLVARLEKGDLALDDALQSFERGVALTRQCQGALKAAQQKVEILLNNSSNGIPEPFAENTTEPLESAP